MREYLGAKSWFDLRKVLISFIYVLQNQRPFELRGMRPIIDKYCCYWRKDVRQILFKQKSRDSRECDRYEHRYRSEFAHCLWRYSGNQCPIRWVECQPWYRYSSLHTVMTWKFRFSLFIGILRKMKVYNSLWISQ